MKRYTVFITKDISPTDSETKQKNTTARSQYKTFHNPKIFSSHQNNANLIETYQIPLKK